MINTGDILNANGLINSDGDALSASSKFGPEVDAILVKPGRDWTLEESKIIQELIKDGQKPILEKLIEDFRNAHPDWDGPKTYLPDQA